MNSTPMDQSHLPRPQFLTTRGRGVFFLMESNGLWILREGNLEYIPNDDDRKRARGNPTYHVRLDEETVEGATEINLFESKTAAENIMEYRNGRRRYAARKSQRCPRCGKYGVRPGGTCSCGFSPSKLYQDQEGRS